MGRQVERDSAYELFRRGSRLLAEHHPGAAAVLLERCLALEPGEALGRAYFNQGAHAEAADRFQSIVDHYPLDDYAHFGLGLSRAKLGDPADAERHLRMAVFLKPENPDYQRALRRLTRAA